MSIQATQIKVEILRSIQNLIIARLTIPSVPATTTSDLILMDVGVSDGELSGIRVSCSSTDYDISVLAKVDGVVDTVDEIYRAQNINLRHSEMNLGIIYSNDDEFVFDSFGDLEETQLLYGIITNNAGVVTGEITIEFVIKVF